MRLPVRPRSWPIVAGFLYIALGIALQDRIPYPVMHSGLLAPGFALLIFGFATQPAWSRFLDMKPLVLLGEASYSLYLLHAMPLVILVCVMHLGGSPHIAAILAAYFCGIILVSIGVFLGIENPMRKLLRPRRAVQPLPAVPV